MDTIYGGCNIGFQFNYVSEYFRDPMDTTIKTVSFVKIPEIVPYTRILVDFPEDIKGSQQDYVYHFWLLRYVFHTLIPSTAD